MSKTPNPVTPIDRVQALIGSMSHATGLAKKAKLKGISMPLGLAVEVLAALRDYHAELQREANSRELGRGLPTPDPDEDRPPSVEA